MESKQQGYGSNQRDPGGEIPEHKRFVLMQNLPSDCMHREEEKTSAHMRHHRIQPELRHVRQRQQTQETTQERC